LPKITEGVYKPVEKQSAVIAGWKWKSDARIWTKVIFGGMEGKKGTPDLKKDKSPIHFILLTKR